MSYRVDAAGFLVNAAGTRVGFKEADGDEVFFPRFNTAVSELLKPDNSTFSGGAGGVWGGITGTLTAQTDLQTALDAKAAYNAPVTLTANTTLTAAAHANRLLIVDSATAVALTLQSDAAGGFSGDDSIFVYRQGVGQATILAGTATLENTTSMLVATAANRAFVSAQRVRANVWAPQEPVAGASTQAIVEMGASATLSGALTAATLVTVSVPANTFLAGKRLRFQAYVDYQAGAGGVMELVYGGTVIANITLGDTFGGVQGVVVDISAWATANNVQKGVPGDGGNRAQNYLQHSTIYTGAIDATAVQTLLLRVTVAASTAITVRQSKAIFE